MTFLRMLSLVLIALPALANAATYYASGSGSGSACSLASPCTVSTGVSTVGAGDTLYIRSGTYSGSLTVTGKAGTASAYITIAGYPGETVTFQPATSNPSIIGANGGSHANYIAFQHLIFDGVNQACNTSTWGFQDIEVKDGAHHWTFDDVEIKNVCGHGFLFASDATGNPTGIVVRNSRIHDLRGVNQPGFRSYCIYLHDAPGAVIEHSDLYSCPGGGIQFYPGPNTNAEFRYNRVHDTSSFSSTTVSCITLSIGPGGPGTNMRIHHNVLYNCGIANPTATISGISLGDFSSGYKVWHNTIYNSKNYGINVSGTGNIIQNNIAYNNPSGNIVVSGSHTVDHNLTANPSFTNAAGGDFSLASGSAAIDAGTTISGFNYNGSAPDIGAFETFIFSACSIANGTPGVINATFTNNVNPPLLPLSGVTTFTARKAGVSDTVTGVTRTGDNQLDIAVQNNYANGNAADISWASGNLTDSALIGGTLNQPYVETLTNQSCTNNVGGSPSYLFIQAAYEWHGLRGTEAAPVMLRTAAGSTENLDIQTFPGGKARLRIAVTCTTADCPPEGFYPYFSRNGGSYTPTPDTFGADNFKFCGTDADPDIPANFTPTTDQLSAAGTLASPIGGQIVRTSNAVPTVDLDDSPATKAELEYCFATDTDTAVDTTFDIQLRRQDGTNTNMQFDVTPRITVRTASGGMGF